MNGRAVMNKCRRMDVGGVSCCDGMAGASSVGGMSVCCAAFGWGGGTVLWTVNKWDVPAELLR